MSIKMTVDGDMRKSANSFKKVVWPKIKHWFGSGDLEPVENVTDVNMAKMLDMYSGIDAWYIEAEKGIRGIGSRVQQGPKTWDTFTIRESRHTGTRTEFEKLCNAIDNDWLYPHWFIQAYVNNGVLLTAALAKTEDIIKFINNHPDCPTRPTSNATFFYITWHEFSKKYKVNLYPEPENEKQTLDKFFG